MRFQTDRLSADCDWIVSHMANKPREFVVYVNLKSSQIKLDELVIPDSKGPPLPEAKE